MTWKTSSKLESSAEVDANNDKLISAAFYVTAAGALVVAGLSFNTPQGIVITVALAAAAIAAFTFARRGEKALSESNIRTNELVDSTPVFFWEYDSDAKKFASIAGNSKKITGYSPNEIKRMTLKQLITATEDFDSKSGAVRELFDFAYGDKTEASIITNLLTKNGDQRIFRHQLTKSSGNIIKGVSSDITEIRQVTDKIRYNAEHDRLTNLANRSSLEAKIKQLLDAGKPLTILMLNVNRFREINDTLGYPVGDDVLKNLAQRFRSEFADQAMAARFASDEFVIVSEGDERDKAMNLASRWTRVTEAKLEVKDIQLAVTPTIGIVISPEHGDTAETLLQRAEIAVSQAKQSGKKVDFFAKTPDSISLDRLTLSGAISGALDAGQFELWFQPKINLKTSAIAGAEGLARWRHPQKGVLLPDTFLELITLSGEYHRFTDHVIETGIEAAAKCATAGHPIEISVNLSALSFLNKDLAGKISSTLDLHGVSPDRFTVEITESDIFDEKGQHTAVFDELSELGLGISIDDFGTGHSSLSRLRNLPVSELKLDQSFIKDLNTEPDDLIIVQNVIDLASSLGHTTIAEGVEDAEIIETLKRLGCMGVQGFFFAKPMPFIEFLEFVEQWPQGTQPKQATQRLI